MSSPTPEQVWAQLQGFVEAYAARRQLREHLGLALGTGRGRIKLLMLLEDGPRAHSELAEALQVDRPYTTVIVNSLEALGLVERTADPADRRRKLVALTDKGTETLAEARAVIGAAPPPLQQLTATELTELAALLTRLDPPADRAAAQG
ncbi:DNA-binding MarR family transcriptional regulator [Motilibacter peucedani]|uniref:DNA-binding MarR family transcriptional regulator n=1 Tax=Motilibacter peucedani TaxID=598650 RepID=A0A420XJQ0_9ACTN|nr:MarR family transcriptional regulator [Motilibacter peucedani]RKS67952.1 DNA-binding MarR family transcriptional regulator [Motilibacter peucedani]